MWDVLGRSGRDGHLQRIQAKAEEREALQEVPLQRRGNSWRLQQEWPEEGRIVEACCSPCNQDGGRLMLKLECVWNFHFQNNNHSMLPDFWSKFLLVIFWETMHSIIQLWTGCDRFVDQWNCDRFPNSSLCRAASSLVASVAFFGTTPLFVCCSLCAHVVALCILASERAQLTCVAWTLWVGRLSCRMLGPVAGKCSGCCNDALQYLFAVPLLFLSSLSILSKCLL